VHLFATADAKTGNLLLSSAETYTSERQATSKNEENIAEGKEITKFLIRI